MEENKNLEAVEETKETAKKTKAKKEKAPKLPKRIKNQALFKRGGYAVAITAAVLAGIIVLNLLVGVLAERVNLEFDMTLSDQNKMDEKNIEFVKKVDKEVEVILCADEKDYVGGAMYNYAYQYYSVMEDYTDYYKQTVRLLEKYNDYNKKIKIKYIDTESSEFNEIKKEYAEETIQYGDIIVSSGSGESVRHKIIGYTDIYSVATDDTYASMGYSMNTVTGNNIETALTSAISYVVSTKSKKVAFLTGHSKTDYSTTFREHLEVNNYEIELISNQLITEISSEFDAVVIVAPTSDFMDTELDAIETFLENDGKYDKGLLFFADSTAPYLTNLYEYLAQWGIGVNEGILFEASGYYSASGKPTHLLSMPSEEELVCLTEDNVAFEALFENEGLYTVSAFASTAPTVVEVPVGTPDSWTGAKEDDMNTYPTVIQSNRMDYYDGTTEINNYVIAFSSVGFLNSSYISQGADNLNLAFKAIEIAVGAENTGIEFLAKTIENETFVATDAQANTIRVIFMIVMPLALLAASIYVYIRRKNS